MTRKLEWDQFSRAIKNRKSFPCELSPYLVKGKVDLFNAWLDAKGSWDECKLVLDRTRKNSTESVSGWVGVQGKKLVDEYGKDKAQILMDRRTTDGLFYDSDDFPDDPLERWYYMKKAKEVNKKNTTEDSAKLQASLHCDNAMLQALVGDDGMMQAGALPSMGISNAQGQKHLLDGLEEGGVSAAPKKKAKGEKEKEEQATKVVPKTLLEQASDLMTSVLAEATTARRKSMSLGAVNYAGELSTQLLEHAQKMEKHYKTLQTAVAANLDNDDFFKRIFKKVDADRQFFLTAEAGVGSWKNIGTKHPYKLLLCLLFVPFYLLSEVTSFLDSQLF